MAREYLYGVSLERCYEACFECPFDECTEARSESIECPRRRCELAQMREEGLIPAGYVVAEELAPVLGVSGRSAREKAVRLRLPYELRRIGQMSWRLYPAELLECETIG